MRGEWIEIAALRRYSLHAVSLPMRGEWIEMAVVRTVPTGTQSLPMRGEWIEIRRPLHSPHPFPVSPHAGRVD